MINNRQQTGRRRGRGGQRPGGSTGSGSGGGGGLGRAPEMGNRIDSRARGNAAQLLEKYKTLARDAQQAGDRVLAEYYLQFADHYFRVLAESRARFDEANPRRAQPEYSDGKDAFDEGDEGEGDDGDDEFAPPRQQQAHPREDRMPQRNEGQRNEGQRNDRAQRSDRAQRNDNQRNDNQRNEGQRNDPVREDRPERVARDDRPQRNEGSRDDRPQRENRAQRDEGPSDDRPRQQPREDRPREDRPRGESAVESEVAEIYRDELVARDERPTRDGTRRRLGMHSSLSGTPATAPIDAPTTTPTPPVESAHDDGGDANGHADEPGLPLDVLPPSISAAVSASIAAAEEEPTSADPGAGVEGEVVAPPPRRRGRPRKVVPETPADA